MSINYSELIPNNVNLSDDRRLQRALEAWQPHYLEWWREMGPEGFQASTPICAPRLRSMPKGGRHSAISRCPTIDGEFFSPPQEPDRRIGFGEHKGEPVWREVPGEHRGCCAA